MNQKSAPLFLNSSRYMLSNSLNPLLFFFFLSMRLLAQSQTKDSKDLGHWVNPFIGTQDAVLGSGCVFPGACMPFGMLKTGPDCDSLGATAGYAPGKAIYGFSQTHASGTGGGASYGNILVMPTTGAIDVSHHESLSEDEEASPGYFSVLLKKYGIKAELTASSHAAIHRYTFKTSEQANILLDAGSFLGHEDKWGEQQILQGSEIRVLSPTEIDGYSRISGGWNMGQPYTVYFYARVDRPAATLGTWKIGPGGRISPGSGSQFDSGQKTGAWLTFPGLAGQSIKIKIGISFISTLKARHNLESEISDWDFGTARNRCREAWNKSLSAVQVEGDADQKTIFYTALYHTMLMPVDKSGENPKWTSSEPDYDDFYTIWDTFRSSSPLLTLIAPDRQRDIVRSMLDIYRHEGYLPDGRMGNENGRTQGGSNAEVILADAWVKGLQGIDYSLALEAMLKDARVPPGGDERKQGRGGLDDYNKLGYVSISRERAGSRTLEYAYNDFCIGVVAAGLGRDSLSKIYFKQAGNWQNLWRKDIKHSGATGFIWPRRRDGSWADTLSELDGTHVTAKLVTFPFTPLTAGSFPNFFYESHSWEYSFFVPQDVRRLIKLCGGEKPFVARLDTFFSKNYYQVGNEPGFLTPVLYNWAGRPDRTAWWTNRILHNYFSSKRNGIPGNDDSGAMSSFYAFHAMGFFPNAGQDIYLISSPVFSNTSIQLGNRKTFSIQAVNLSKKNIYIRSATLDGKPLSRSWFRHTEIANGAILKLKMGSKPSSWARDKPPPSQSDISNF